MGWRGWAELDDRAEATTATGRRLSRSMAPLIALAVLAALALLPPAGASASPARVRAGVAVVDASWHVGAAAGSHGTESPLGFIGTHGIDPTTHSVKRLASYGVQSRLSIRAIVVEGPDGRRVALVKNDLFIPQDLLDRRTAQILEADGRSGITRANLTIAVSHDHSSPYYSSPDWGVQLASQDIFDVRFFDYYARRMALAVERAAAHLVPVRVGASVSYFDKTHRNSMGGEVADDGTPAGYLANDTDHDLTVVRFDDISHPRPRPLAVLVNYSLHPEFLPSGLDLITGDYIAPLERMVDRRTGAVTIFTQNAVGTSEPEQSDYDQPYDDYHSIHQRLEFHYKGYSQAERGARLMADSAIDTWRDVARRTPQYPGRFVPFSSRFPVAMDDRWFPGPISHPYPSFGNCRTAAVVEGHPRAPTDLPTCQDAVDTHDAGIDPGVSLDDLKARGIPVPDTLSPPAYLGLEEDVGVHLQAFRLGSILFTVCSCEQWKDQSYNIKTRTNRIAGDEYLGTDWSKRCRADGDGTYRPDGSGSGHWTCPDPFNPIRLPVRDLPPVTDRAFQYMRHEVRNDAKGWDQLDYVTRAESEPADPRLDKGNYTHDDTSANARYGYRLTVPISMANDYNGYLATYREYQSRDHYRKSLTGWGPHSSDYMATRLVEMGRHLNGGPQLPPETGNPGVAAILAAKVSADLAHNDAEAAALGEVGDTGLRAYEAALPDDGGPVAAVRQPAGIERFAGAFFTWNGGSNFTDNPVVTVQRRVGRRWASFADQSGEVQVTLRFPQGEDVPSYLTGSYRWQWTAHFEAFVSDLPDLGGRSAATPAGTYRFAVSGLHRVGHGARPYRIASRPFRIAPWSGITAEDLRVARNGAVSYRVGPRRTIQVPYQASAGAASTAPGARTFPAVIGPIDYPDTYRSQTRFIDAERSFVRDPDAPNDPRRFEWYCFECSFRPWADTGDAASGFVTVIARDGSRRRVRAVRRGDRWVARRALCGGGTAYVAARDVRDRFGDFNGRRSRQVRLGRARCSGGTGGRAPRHGHPRPRFTG